MAILDTSNLKYKNETNPKFKFIPKKANCVNTDCKNYIKCSLNRLKSCKEAFTYIKVIGIESQIKQLIPLLKKSKISIYNGQDYPLTYFKGNSIRFISVKNTSINKSFEKHCNKFDLIQINGDNPFF